jgi:hypothetical protein
MLGYATKVSSAELQERQQRALGRLQELQAEMDGLPGHISEAASADNRRRIEAAKGEADEVGGDSELSALLRRQQELPHEINAAKIAAAELEVERIESLKSERQAVYEKLGPEVETARIGAEEAVAYYEQKSREQNAHSPNSMLDYDLQRAKETLREIELQEAPRG